MFKFFLRSDNYVYKKFLEALVVAIKEGSTKEVSEIGTYIILKRPKVVARLFKLFKPYIDGKRFSNKSEEGVV